MSEPIDPQREYTPAEAAGRLGVSADTVRRWLQVGTLAGELRAGRWRVSGAELVRVRRANRLALTPTATPAARTPARPPGRRPLKHPRGLKADRRRGRPAG